MIKYLAFCILIAAGYMVYSNFPEKHGPGIVAKNKPKIENLTWQKPFTFKGATLTPVKLLDAEVRVIKREKYYFDELSKYSPIDAMIGWDEMSDEKNLEYTFFKLKNRSYSLEPTRPPLEISKIYAQSDLWHLIPSTSDVSEKLKRLRNGNVIRVKGMLVDISEASTFNFVTSKEISASSRKDSFTVWIEELHIR